MFETPNFTFGTVVYTAIGAAVFWARWGRADLRVFVLSRLLDVFSLDANTRVVIEFVLFVTLGCIVGIGILNPVNATQALTAGFGWTGAFAIPPHHMGKSQVRR